MTEPDVALTDYALALECAVFAAWLARSDAGSPVRGWAILFFAALTVAPLAGGTVHGFFLDTDSLGHRVLWPVTLIAIGVAAAAAWMIGASLQFSAGVARRARRVAALGLAAYAFVILFVLQSFIVAMAFYLPAALFLVIVMGGRYVRTKERAALTGLGGLLLTFVASGVQVGQVALHPIYFNHNALYHAIQAIALALIYVAVRDFIAGGGAVTAPC
jgi:hypothetical protein